MASEPADESPELVAVSSDAATERARLSDLIAQATSKYAVKDYGPASELYSQATELQAELNGEMAVENAELLYSYGKCLYFVAVSKSDVLGAKAAGEKVGNLKEEKKSKPKRKLDAVEEEQDQKVVEEVVANIATEKDAVKEEADTGNATKKEDKPLFQFTGDENWDDSDEEDAEDEAGGDEEEEDDFSNAFEILDVARVLLLRQLEQLENDAAETDGKGKGKVTDSQTSPEIRQVKERLADTHDLQAEISLEGERFPSAVTDLRAALALKEQLYPFEHSQIAECHYKLSLALEFSSVTQQKDENGEIIEGQQATIDESMRKEAAAEMEKAIESCELRIQKEQADVDGRANAPEGDSKGKQITQKDIDEVKEMVGDMRQRLVDLRAPPVSINDPKSTGTLDGSTPLNGILGQILGESAEEQKKRLEEASKNATDLSGLVKRKKPTAVKTEAEAQTNGTTTEEVSGKRKVDIANLIDGPLETKKAKVEDGEEAA